jgi:hypothetical protein
MGDGGVPIHGFHIFCHVSSPKSQVGVSRRAHAQPALQPAKQVLCHPQNKKLTIRNKKKSPGH